MRLVTRDLLILRELERWRFVLGRQLRLLCAFPSQRTCDRRTKLLIEAGYIERRHVLYGVPGLHLLTHKGRILIHASPKPEKIRVEQIVHNIAVVDTALYFAFLHKLPLTAIITEKQLHQQDGFGVRQHRPDFVFSLRDETHCVEVELTPKSKERLIKNVRANFMAYTRQHWILPPHTQHGAIARVLKEQAVSYPNLDMMTLETVTEFVRQY